MSLIKIMGKIFGVVPVGGSAKRLGLPPCMSKEMLPQVGLDHYKPISSHVVDKMLEAGAEKVVFVHGERFKDDIVDYYSGNRFKHITQARPGFARVLMDFHASGVAREGDYVFFGLPDTVFAGNPFCSMTDVVSCGLFHVPYDAIVDRLERHGNCFHVKSPKMEANTQLCWGVLGFPFSSIGETIRLGYFDVYGEIGEILNLMPGKDFIYGGDYLDLGTWDVLNKYWKSHG